MEQKRYESDMTPKEKRELERKKLKQMTAGQKLEYIWAYYKQWRWELFCLLFLSDR